MITLDTNVLAYCYDVKDRARQIASLQVFDAASSGSSKVGVQAIGELYNVLTTKFRRQPSESAQAARNIYAAFESSFAPTVTAMQEALLIASAGHLRYWDALLVVSAREAGCTILVSEDMNPGPFRGVEIVKPFNKEGVLQARVRQVLDL